MDVIAVHSSSGFTAATVGVLTGLLAGILWFPRLYIAIPVVVATCTIYAAFAVLLLRPNFQDDRRVYIKLTILSSVLVSILAGFAIGGTYLATTLCGLPTYTQWMFGSVNPCGVCISGNVFLWTALIFWVAATCYAAKAARELSVQQADKSWGDDTTVLPPV